MARGNGRPYIGTVQVSVGVTDFSSLNSGQWIQLPNGRKARFVRNRQTGETYFVSGNKKRKRLSMGEFRLACGVEENKVLPAAR